MALEFLHVGVPTTQQMPNETYMEPLKVYITNPGDHPFKYEFLRYVPGTDMPRCITMEPHVAFKVDSMAEALKCAQEDLYTIDLPDCLIKFVRVDGAILELTEMK